MQNYKYKTSKTHENTENQKIWSFAKFYFNTEARSDMHSTDWGFM